MSYTAHFHVGILVADIDRAIARFSDALGVSFTEPTEQITTLYDPEPAECHVRAAYSTTSHRIWSSSRPSVMECCHYGMERDCTTLVSGLRTSTPTRRAGRA